MGIRHYIHKTGEGWLYLTTVIDLADRKVIGWALGETVDTAVAAFKMAVKKQTCNAAALVSSRPGRTVCLQGV